jgi:hypothetical protein
MELVTGVLIGMRESLHCRTSEPKNVRTKMAFSLTGNVATFSCGRCRSPTARARPRRLGHWLQCRTA